MLTDCRHTIWLLAATLALAGCHDFSPLNTISAVPSSQAASTQPPFDVDERIDGVELLLRQQFRSAEARLDRRATLGKLFAEPESLAIAPDLAFDTLREVYRTFDSEPQFTTHSALNDQGVELAEQLFHARRHGLDPHDYHAARIRELVEALRRRPVDSLPTLTPFAFDARQRDVLTHWMLTRYQQDTAVPSSEAIAHLLTSDDRRNPLPELVGIASLSATQLAEMTHLSLELELLLADGYIKLARDLRFANRHYLSPDEAASQGWDLENPETMAIIAEKQAGASLVAAIASGDVGEAMHALSPPFEQYQRLQKGADEYLGYVRAGGWSEHSLTREMSAGQSYDQVPALRRRLAAERYWTGDLESRTFDRALSDAVLHYQRTHQLVLNGHVDEYTLASLNIPAEQRLAQIYQTLRRWHSTRLAQNAGGEYIVVNVPDFHAELWDDDARIYRWGVIVGKLKRARDAESGELRMWGATPLFSDEVEFVVFNPYWNVPGSIYANEYRAKIEEDPLYLEEHNFEVITNDVGNQFLRQKPGPDNALGLVKFLFPNEHHVYLHDTNRPRLFEYNIRAFSHGCIRVENALELAALLLSRDRDQPIATSEYFIRELLEKGEEQWVVLRRHIPIHLDYFAVRGGDEGRMHFLADVYRLDREAVDGLTEEVLREQEMHVQDARALEEDVERARQRRADAPDAQSANNAAAPATTSPTASATLHAADAAEPDYRLD